LCSTNGAVKASGERLLDLIEELVVAESRGNANNLLQPIVSMLNQNQNKSAKPLLVDRLCSKYLSKFKFIALSFDETLHALCLDLIERVDKVSMIERYLHPLLQPNGKLA
jgi:hypothetical protein